MEPTKSGNNIVIKPKNDEELSENVPIHKLPKPFPWYILNPDRMWLKALDTICEVLSLPTAMLYLFFIAFGFC
jgi:hypothetical protein